MNVIMLLSAFAPEADISAVQIERPELGRLLIVRSAGRKAGERHRARPGDQLWVVMPNASP